MDKQKQREEIRDILCANIYCGETECGQCRVSQCAEALIDADYGNLKEFAQKLTAKVDDNSINLMGKIVIPVEWLKTFVGELLKERTE